MTTPVEVTELPRLPPRQPDSHKGTYGRVLIVAGSRGMSGAAILSGMGALRGGAGLVQVATPAEILPIVAGYEPSYLTAPLPQDAEGRVAVAAADTVIELAAQSSVLALGPGLGQSEQVTHVVRRILDQVALPIVLDADGLNALARILNGSLICEVFQRSSPLILTPHPGEFARLTRTTAGELQQQREQVALQFADRHKVVLVLKGHQTLVTDGRQLYCNTTGNPGMATGGTGDVLTGLIAAFLAQRLEPFPAAQLGVYLHGLAGDLSRNQLGEVSLIATDLLEHLPQAFCHIA
jgi:NAD(P)H-hydrate epimerase